MFSDQGFGPEFLTYFSADNCHFRLPCLIQSFQLAESVRAPNASGQVAQRRE
eukprot:m.500599 g.500599  ORF g.500599 m.500599 type:complete len:52 (-) comp197131_c0_seq1:17-172(-)